MNYAMQRNSEIPSAMKWAGFRPASPALPLTEITQLEFRNALTRAVTPVTIVTTGGAEVAGVTCSAVCSVCDTPPTILVCINRKSFANSVIKANGVLCVNWLSADQSSISQMFAGAGAVPMEERFASDGWGVLATGAPYFRDALVALDCKIADIKEVGSHTVILAEVQAISCADSAEPLIYCQRAYATTRPVQSN